MSAQESMLLMRDARLLAVVTPSKQLPTDALRSPRAFGSRPSRPIRCGVVRVLDLPLLLELLGCDAADRDEHLADPGVDNYCC